MEIKPAALVLADISGYTAYIKQHPSSALHAEQHITTLLEAVTARAEYPLKISKFEGDAVFMYAAPEAEQASDEMVIARSVTGQVTSFFTAFDTARDTINDVTAKFCTCQACTTLFDLKLKVLLHIGQVVFKKIRDFEEVAGEPAIVIHRLLKNSVRSREYIMMTDNFQKLGGGIPGKTPEQRVEHSKDLGRIPVYVYYVKGAPPSDTLIQRIRRAFGLQRN